MGEAGELLPCPFCGGTDISQSSWDVKCGNCGAEAPGGIERARAAWNRRAITPAKADVERLTEQLAISERNRDAARANFHTMQQAADTLRMRAEAAEARVAVLEEALEPFAAYAWALRGRRDSELEIGWMSTNETGEPVEVNLTVGTFLAARAALHKEAE